MPACGRDQTRRHGVQHRKSKPYTPRTNGMVERFNGWVQREVLGITRCTHADLEIALRGFNVAYNGRRQRVLDGLSPEMVLRQRLDADPALANPSVKPPQRGLLRKALRVVADAKKVSQPNTEGDAGVCGAGSGAGQRDPSAGPAPHRRCGGERDTPAAQARPRSGDGPPV